MLAWVLGQHIGLATRKAAPCLGNSGRWISVRKDSTHDIRLGWEADSHCLEISQKIDRGIQFDGNGRQFVGDQNEGGPSNERGNRKVRA